MPLSYDRRPPRKLIEALEPDGFAHALTGYARDSRWPLDLQFRGHGPDSEHWATLYMGLTAVLNLKLNTKGFALTAHATWAQAKYGWRTDWNRRRTTEEMRNEWPAVERYLHLVVPNVPPRHVAKEGAVQASITGPANDSFVVIDREAELAGATTGEVKAQIQAQANLLYAATQNDPGEDWWKPSASLGRGCDALAIDARGELLTIEVKGPSDLTHIPWAAVQARHYAQVFQLWVDQDEQTAADILTEMLSVRTDLCLTPASPHALKRPLTVRPVVAIGLGARENAFERLTLVVERLRQFDLDDPALEVFTVSLTGKFTRVPI